jgi:hypothetical protein
VQITKKSVIVVSFLRSRIFMFSAFFDKAKSASFRDKSLEFKFDIIYYYFV